MIFELYLFLLAISIIFIVVGIFRPAESLFAVVGFTIMFLLGLIMLNGTLSIPAGATVTSTFSYSGSSINGTTQTITNEYTTFSDSTSHWVGWLIMILGVGGFIIMLFSIRGGTQK
jgi:hypothetical protein